jgi:hypothetical protein
MVALLNLANSIPMIFHYTWKSIRLLQGSVWPGIFLLFWFDFQRPVSWSRDTGCSPNIPNPVCVTQDSLSPNLHLIGCVLLFRSSWKCQDSFQYHLNQCVPPILSHFVILPCFILLFLILITIQNFSSGRLAELLRWYSTCLPSVKPWAQTLTPPKSSFFC